MKTWRIIMNYKISKYDAIKVVLKAEKSEDKKLIYNLMQIIRRAARQEIDDNIYNKYYVLNENEIKVFNKLSHNYLIQTLKK